MEVELNWSSAQGVKLNDGFLKLDSELDVLDEPELYN